MAAPTKLFLEYNGIDNRWKVVDENGFCFGDGRTVKEAVQSARVVTDQDIYFHDGLVYVNKPETGLTKDVFDFIDELAEIGGMEVTRIYNNDDEFQGFKMELIE